MPGLLPKDCAVCGRVPAVPDAEVVHHLHFPTPHTRRKVAALLRQAGAALGPGDGGCGVVEARLDHAGVVRLAELARPACSRLELEDTRVLSVAEDHRPSFGDAWRTLTFGAFLARHEGRWLGEMLVAERVACHFQPIVHADDPARVHAHEALLRCTDADGSPLSAARVIRTAREARLAFQLDVAARRAALHGAAGHGLRGGLFINFAPTVVYDPDHCLRSTIALVDELGMDPSRITFEVIESEHMQDLPTLRRTLDRYRSRGFRVALDDLGAGFGSLNLLHAIRPDVVKLDMELTRDIDREPFKATIARKLLEAAAELGVETVAEGVETPGELRCVREAGATYVQGYLIGRPAPRPETPSRVLA